MAENINMSFVPNKNAPIESRLGDAEDALALLADRTEYCFGNLIEDNAKTEHTIKESSRTVRDIQRQVTVVGKKEDGASGVGKFANAEKTSEIFNDYKGNTAEGSYQHAEGSGNALNYGATYSHAEGQDNTISSATYSHAEGQHNNLTNGSYNHAEGEGNAINGGYANHADGYYNTLSSCDYTSVSGQNNKVSDGFGSAVSGQQNTTSGDCNIVGGMRNTLAYGQNNVIAGMNSTLAAAHESVIVGQRNGQSGTISNSIIAGTGGKFSGVNNGNTVNGINNTVSGDSYSIIIGNENTVTDSNNTAVLGGFNAVSGVANQAAVLGWHNTLSKADGAFVAGQFCEARAPAVIAAGDHLLSVYVGNTVFGKYNLPKDLAFSVGIGTGENDRKNAIEADWRGNVAIGSTNSISTAAYGAFIAGQNCVAVAPNVFAVGDNIICVAKSNTAFGKFNIPKDLAFCIGIGTDNANRKNALEVDWDGNVTVAGRVLANAFDLYCSVIEENTVLTVPVGRKNVLIEVWRNSSDSGEAGFYDCCALTLPLSTKSTVIYQSGNISVTCRADEDGAVVFNSTAQGVKYKAMFYN